MRKTLEYELITLLNGFSEENESNTPDFILARYMQRSLDAFNEATRSRDRWYGVHLELGNSVFEKGRTG